MDRFFPIKKTNAHFSNELPHQLYHKYWVETKIETWSHGNYPLLAGGALQEEEQSLIFIKDFS